MVKFLYKRLRKGAGRMEAKLLAFLHRARRMHSAQGGGPGGENLPTGPTFTGTTGWERGPLPAGSPCGQRGGRCGP